MQTRLKPPVLPPAASNWFMLPHTGSYWFGAGGPRQHPELVVPVDHAAVGGVLYVGGTPAAAAECGSGHVLVGGVDGRALAGDGAEGADTPPQQDGADDQQQDAAGQPDARRQLPARPAATFAVLAQSAEHLTLVPHGVRRLARHAQEVGRLGEEVGEVRAGVADGDALLVHEALALVAHQDAVPVGVVHDAVEAVPAAGGRGPAHPGRGAGDVVDRHSHVAPGLPPARGLAAVALSK